MWVLQKGTQYQTNEYHVCNLWFLLVGLHLHLNNLKPAGIFGASFLTLVLNAHHFCHKWWFGNCLFLQILKERFGMVAPDVEIEDGKGQFSSVGFGSTKIAWNLLTENISHSTRIACNLLACEALVFFWWAQGAGRNLFRENKEAETFKRGVGSGAGEKKNWEWGEGALSHPLNFFAFSCTPGFCMPLTFMERKRPLCRLAISWQKTESLSL